MGHEHSSLDDYPGKSNRGSRRSLRDMKNSSGRCLGAPGGTGLSRFAHLSCVGSAWIESRRGTRTSDVLELGNYCLANSFSRRSRIRTWMASASSSQPNTHTDNGPS